MGLDNYPSQYPCKKQGTVVLSDDGLIDCQATQACGGCPWKNADKPDDGRVLGMFGTDCWYRGKYGNALLSEMGLDDDDLNFYGDNEDGTEKSPESCVALADVIGEALVSDRFTKEVEQGLRYAEWYLRWAAEECDGLECWY